MVKKMAKFVQGQALALNKKTQENPKAVGQILKRIGCTHTELTTGRIKVVEDEGSQLRVSRPGKSGNIHVAKRFFEAHPN